MHAIWEKAAVASGQAPEKELDGLLAYPKTRIEALQETVGTTASTFRECGDPPEVISRRAADLLVVDRHEASGLHGRFFQRLYSIVCDSPCPVLSI